MRTAQATHITAVLWMIVYAIAKQDGYSGVRFLATFAAFMAAASFLASVLTRWKRHLVEKLEEKRKEN